MEAKLPKQTTIKKQYTTEVNPVNYVFLNKPALPFGMTADINKEGVYRADMEISEEEYETIEKLCMEAAKEHCEANGIKMPNAKFLSFPIKIDEDTGKHILKIKQKGYRQDKQTGEKVLRTILVVDSVGNPIDLKKHAIFSGSEIAADLTLSTFKGKELCVTAYINAVQLVKLVTGMTSNSPKRENRFKNIEDGFTIDSVAPKDPSDAVVNAVADDEEDDF